MNPTSFNASFIRIPLLSIALIALTNTAIAGGSINGHSIMDDYLKDKASTSAVALSTSKLSTSITINNNALVFNRGATDVDNDDFDKKFSFAKTLTSIRNSSGATTNSTDTQLLNSLLNTLKVSSKTNGFVEMDLQKREEKVSLSAMSPTAIFNRFDLSASNGEHCGEYRVVYHKNNGGRFFLIFESQYPNPEPSKGKQGCFAVADFWQKIGDMSKTDALAQLEKFFYKGLVHKGVKLPAAINFANYTHGTGQVRSNSFIKSPWQLREFKADINAKGEVVFVADSVKSNPLTNLFAGENNTDSDSLKALKINFDRDFDAYADNLLAPERRASNPSSSDIINGFSLDNDDSYNEFQSDASDNDNTAKGKNKNLNTIINNKLTALNLPNYNAKMIRNRAEAMSCGGCHQNSNDTEIAPNVNWPKSRFFVHVDEQGTLSPALIEQFLPARAALLKDYLQKTTGTTVEKWRFAEVDYSSARNDFGFHNASNNFNNQAFATLQADGSITAWGNSGYGGTGAPTGSGYTKIYSNRYAFAALKIDGSITAWGDSDFGGGTGAPTGSGYTKIYSNPEAFAAIKADGSITAWGLSSSGGTGAPTGSGYTKIYSTGSAFAALKADGSITAWGNSVFGGGTGAPTDNGYTKIYSNQYAFAAIKADGSITAWGSSSSGGSDAPTGSGYIKIYSTVSAFAALKADGSITAWGSSYVGGTGAPTGSGYTKIYSAWGAFAALKADGSITAWGDPDCGGAGAPTGVYTKIYSNAGAFAALKADGSITAWGNSAWGGTAPTGSGYTKIYSNEYAFAALKADGSITAWGNSNYGGIGAPDDSGYTKIYSTLGAFVAVKADGSIKAWGDPSHGGTTPTVTD
ncbi:hypothetical protein BPUTSESOX_2221 [uncultured Gammaproteobacteria bacterium]|nr:hypothetical protein BPUTSESOX_2221 [uncultured Gammaproteobacteria bacterium]